MDSRYIVNLLVMVAAFLPVGCDGDDTYDATGGNSTSSGAGGQASTSSSNGSGQSSASSSAAGGMPALDLAFVSIAHLSPDAPALEFCVSFDGKNFMGPVLGPLASAFSYRDVLSYIPVPAAPLTYRIIAKDATSCDTPLKDSRDSVIPTTVNKSYTFMVVGQSSPPDDAKAIQIKSIEEDPTPAQDKLRLRFVHVSPNVANLDFGTGAGAAFKALFSDVAYGSPGVASGATYLATDPLADATLSVRAHGAATDTLSALKISLPAGRNATAYAISDKGSSTTPSHLLLCEDNGPKKNYTFIKCSSVP